MALRSLRALTGAFLLVFVTVTLLTGYGIYRAGQTSIDQLVDRRLSSESESVAADGDAESWRIAERIDVFTRDRNTGDLGILLTDAHGKRIAGNMVLPHPLPPGYSSVGEETRIKGLSQGRALVRRIGGGMMLTTIAETEPFDHYNAVRLRTYLIGFGAILVIVIGATVAFGVAIGRRIGEMRRTVSAIIDGDLARRLPVDGSGSEFDLQAQAFNRMLDRIQALVREISNVSDEIAHDLRTPLARLRNQLSQLERQPGAPDLRERIEAAIAQCDEILAMFAAVLRIAEIEGGARRAGSETLDLGALAADTSAMMEPVASEAGHALTVAACTMATVRGDRRLLSQALINLIENAIKHTPAGSHIAVSVDSADGQALLAVRDDGPGIASDQHPHALRRFGRLDKSRGRPGHGLGLPLVESIARLHGGTLALEDAAPGLRAVIALPLA